MANPQAVVSLVTDAASKLDVRARLVADPKKALADAGYPVPANTQVSIFVNDAKTFHAVLPVQGPGEIEAVRAVNPLAANVIERAWRDSAFKKKLMSSPREAFIEATGVTPPQSLKLVPHENTATTLNIVIPYLRATSELSDSDLEHVAGGKGAAAVQAACGSASGVGMAVAQAGGQVGGTVGGVAAIGGLLTAGGAALGSWLKN